MQSDIININKHKDLKFYEESDVDSNGKVLQVGGVSEHAQELSNLN